MFRLKIQNPPPCLVIIMLLLIPLLLVAGPMFSIWSINTLFGTEIQVNFWTWLAALWLMAIVMCRQSGD